MSSNFPTSDTAKKFWDKTNFWKIKKDIRKQNFNKKYKFKLNKNPNIIILNFN